MFVYMFIYLCLKFNIDYNLLLSMLNFRHTYFIPICTMYVSIGCKFVKKHKKKTVDCANIYIGM